MEHALATTIEPTTIALLCLCAASAAISAVEAALLCTREHHLPGLAGGSDFYLEKLVSLFERRESVLTSLLLLGAVAQLGMAVFGLQLAGDLAERLNLPAAAIAAGLFIAIILLFDAAPKTLALARPGWLLRRSNGAALLLESLLRPASRAMGSIARALASRIAPKGLAPVARIEDEEVHTLVRMRHASGDLPEWEAEVIHEIVKLGDKTAKDIMTPRVNVVTVAEKATRDQVRAALGESQHRLLPVYRNEPDEIVGVLDVVAFLAGRELAQATSRAAFVPEIMAALDLFGSHLAEPHRMVIVIDEHGGFEGIATTSDIIEDLVRDALPPDSGRSEIHPLGDGRFLASGSARLDDLGDVLDARLAEDGIDTIGGLIFTRCGQMPEAGESFSFVGHRAVVRQVTSKRIEEVLIEPDGEREVAE